jgi:uncharacterized protein YbcV (DUF1398 family)
MNTTQRETAERCMHAAHDGTMSFPAIIGALLEAGFEGYHVDYRGGTVTYHLPSGDGAVVAAPDITGPVAPRFDATIVEQAVREAQTNAPGYTYLGFCSKVRAAGCAGYLVSFLGKRVVYYGRTAETHVELFPKAPE